MIWNCPICSVRIRGIQVKIGYKKRCITPLTQLNKLIQYLYIDYQTKKALVKYPDEEKFLRESNDTYNVISNLSEAKVSASITEKRPPEYQVISVDDDDDNEADRNTKKPKLDDE